LSDLWSCWERSPIHLLLISNIVKLCLIFRSAKLDYSNLLRQDVPFYSAKGQSEYFNTLKSLLACFQFVRRFFGSSSTMSLNCDLPNVYMFNVNHSIICINYDISLSFSSSLPPSTPSPSNFFYYISIYHFPCCFNFLKINAIMW